MTGKAVIFGKLGPGRPAASAGAVRASRSAAALAVAACPIAQARAGKLPPVSSTQWGGMLARKAANSKLRRGWPGGDQVVVHVPTRRSHVTLDADRGPLGQLPGRAHPVARLLLQGGAIVPIVLRVLGEPVLGRAMARLATDAVLPDHLGCHRRRTDTPRRVAGEATRVLRGPRALPAGEPGRHLLRTRWRETW